MAVSQELLDILICPLDENPGQNYRRPKRTQVPGLPARLPDSRRHPRHARG